MTTTTQHGQITLPTSELRQILAVLDEYTTSDKTRHVMTLAQVRPNRRTNTTTTRHRPPP
jgi:hypothetical protein